MKNKKKWLSSFDHCDICKTPIKGVEPWFVDGKTNLRGGVWALLCPSCYRTFGVGIGLGKGQQYHGTTAELLAGDK